MCRSPRLALNMSDATAPAASLSSAQDPYRTLLDEVGAFVYTTDLEGRYTYANGLVLQLLGGHTLESVLGREFGDFVQIPDAVSSALRATDMRVLRDGETIACEESNLIRATGELRTYWSIKKPLRGADGRITGMLGISHDITEKKRLEDQVRQQKELLDAVLNNIDALVYMKDAHRRFVYANPSVARAFGLPVEAIIGKQDTELMPQEIADEFWVLDQQIMATGERQAREAAMQDPSGRLRHYWSVVVPGTAPGGTPAVIGLSTDITELHELKEQLQRRADSDSLTGLANRHSFWEQAEREFALSRRHGTALALLAVDIDHFKQVNDNHGHPMGDKVLRAFADCCRQALRATDLCARTGGEEFCILLPATDLEGALAMAERIRTQVEALSLDAMVPSLRISASFGVAAACEQNPGFDTLFSRADRALYAAKRQGRNRAVAWNDGAGGLRG